MGADLESVGLTWDHLGDLSEEQRSLASEAAGNRTPARFRTSGKDHSGAGS